MGDRVPTPGIVGRRSVLFGMASLALPIPRPSEAALVERAATADEPVAASLAGQLLVASRDLDDPGFAEAVIYLMAHDEGGGHPRARARRR
jgi:hypothetical protein